MNPNGLYLLINQLDLAKKTTSYTMQFYATHNKHHARKNVKHVYVNRKIILKLQNFRTPAQLSSITYILLKIP